MGGLSLPVGYSLVDTSAPRRLLKISGIYISHVVVEGRTVYSNIDGFFSFLGYLLAVLIYYCEMGNVDFGMIVGHTVLVNCTVDMTAVFFDSILETLAGLTYVGEGTIFIGTGPFVDNDLFKV